MPRNPCAKQPKGCKALGTKGLLCTRVPRHGLQRVPRHGLQRAREEQATFSTCHLVAGP